MKQTLLCSLLAICACNPIVQDLGGGGGATGATSSGSGTGTKTTPGSGTTGAGGNAGTGGALGAGGGGGSGDSPPPTKDCFAWPPADTGGDGGSVDAGACPVAFDAALAVFLAENCPSGFEPRAVVGLADNGDGDCCYMVDLMLCGAGRPYCTDDGAQLAPLERGQGPQAPGTRGWSSACPETPRLDGLTADDRASLAEAWASAGLFEHASVASFARFSLELLAAGAPSDLIGAAHEAALDEIEHARLCFALASAYAGEELAPGAFPLGGGVRVGSGLADLAMSTVVEGCIGETVAAMVAAEQLARAEDPAVRAVLARIAVDEARHAELAWKTVAWAVRTGDREVRAAVERALLAAFARDPGTLGDDGGSPVPSRLSAHGLLDPPTRAQIVASAMKDVVAPAAVALLGRGRIAPRSSGWASTVESNG
jgi:hypothetical protein